MLAHAPLLRWPSRGGSTSAGKPLGPSLGLEPRQPGREGGQTAGGRVAELSSAFRAAASKDAGKSRSSIYREKDAHTTERKVKRGAVILQESGKK